MIAPSEKHLEDWIVANPQSAFNEGVSIVKRQVVLPSGIADMIAIHPTSLLVIELKKGLIDTACVAQVLRYMADVQGIYENLVHKMLDRRTLDWHEYAYAYRSMNATIVGVLIGSGYADKYLPVICDGANVSLITYEYSADGEYSFSLVTSPSHRHARASYETFFDADLIVAMKEHAFKCVDQFTQAGGENSP